LIVGAANSGAEIAKELARRGRKVVMAGSHPGEIPFRPERFFARHVLLRVLFRVVFHRVLTSSTPIGRKVRPKMMHAPAPLIRVKARDLDAAGVERTPRATGVRNGLPQLADGRVLDVANVIWSTGF